MNWLAHLLLSEPDPAFRIGNLLPDILPPADLGSLPGRFQDGIRQHRRIDAFTDSHPVVRRSIGRFSPAFRRFGGILTDVFHDHFLAREWSSYSDQPLEDFAATVYSSFDLLHDELPPQAFVRLKEMKDGNWLCSYREIAGIRDALDRIGSRLRRPCKLGDALHELDLHHDAFFADFTEFFPDLRAHVSDGVSSNRHGVSG